MRGNPAFLATCIRPEAPQGRTTIDWLPNPQIELEHCGDEGAATFDPGASRLRRGGEPA